MERAKFLFVEVLKKILFLYFLTNSEILNELNKRVVSTQVSCRKLTEYRLYRPCRHHYHNSIGVIDDDKDDIISLTEIVRLFSYIHEKGGATNISRGLSRQVFDT